VSVRTIVVVIAIEFAIVVAVAVAAVTFHEKKFLNNSRITKTG